MQFSKYKHTHTLLGSSAPSTRTLEKRTCRTPQNLINTTMKRAINGKAQGSAGDGCVCIECLEVLEDDRMKGPVGENLRQKPEIE